MATFPTLSAEPDVRNYSETIAYDPTIRSDTEGGYTITRARFTRLRKKWHIYYPVMTVTDKDTLQNFEKSVLVGSDSFEWTNPADGQTYTVRFVTSIIYRPLSTKNYWIVEFDLEEV